jgi:hypothetical protein
VLCDFGYGEHVSQSYHNPLFSSDETRSKATLVLAFALHPLLTRTFSVAR